MTVPGALGGRRAAREEATLWGSRSARAFPGVRAPRAGRALRAGPGRGRGAFLKPDHPGGAGAALRVSETLALRLGGQGHGPPGNQS